ncbi:hypothetical protein ACS0TY_027509 [Phlomoides rotata]
MFSVSISDRRRMMAEEEPPLIHRLYERLIPEITSILPSLIASVMANLGPDLGYLIPSSKPPATAVTIPTPAVSAFNAHPIINDLPNKDLAPHRHPNLPVDIAAQTLIASVPETTNHASSSRRLNPPVPPPGKGSSSSTITDTFQIIQTLPETYFGCVPGAAPAIAHGEHTKSYAQAVSATPTISKPASTDVLHAIKPVRKGLYLTVAVDENLQKQGVLELRDSLIGRVTHARGDKPLVQADLIKKLTAIWGIRTTWSLIPIGVGCGDDRERIFAKRTWQIKPGLLRLQRWVQDFNPYKVSSSIAQVWIRILELPLEYWNTNILTALASAIGTVIKLDERTASRSMGRFARVLVELDLKQDREEYVMFERAGHRLVVYIQYERLPEFCNFCNVMGHSTGKCGTKQVKNKSAPSDPKMAPKADPPPGGTKQWVQRTFGGTWPPDNTNTPAATQVTGSSPSSLNKVKESANTDVPCSNKFGVLAEEGLNTEELDLADKDTSTDASGLAATDVDTDLISIKELEVHLPPIKANTDLGGSPTNDTEEQALIISHPIELQQESHDTSVDGFKRDFRLRGKRGSGRPPNISKDYNLRNRSQVSVESQREATYVPGPGFIIPKDNSTRPLQAMRLVAGEKWGDIVDFAPPKHGDNSDL